MARSAQQPLIPWLAPGEPFPPPAQAWGAQDPAPGLLAAGGALDVPTLVRAYSHGIFPWFSEGQPILWWSTHPRLVLRPEAFRLHRSLRKQLQSLRHAGRLEVRFDHDFETVIRHCASTPRHGQNGTWIVPAMVQAYVQLHRAGMAHSVETWIDGQLLGGLYGVQLGAMVFGESMFSLQSNASKIALAALVAYCRRHGIGLIDCQQNTAHLSSLGAELMDRAAFAQHLQNTVHQAAVPWCFETADWDFLFAEPRSSP